VSANKKKGGINMELSANMKLRPLGARVIIKPQEVDEKTKGGLFIPETASKERPQVGKVVAVGPGKTLDSGEKLAMDVKENDMVIFSKYAGTEIKLGEDTHLILTEADILAIAEG
jgi:chaperonin GroES